MCSVNLHVSIQTYMPCCVLCHHQAVACGKYPTGKSLAIVHGVRLLSVVLFSNEDLNHFTVNVLLCEQRLSRSSWLRVQMNREPPLQSAAVGYLNIWKGNTNDITLSLCVIAFSNASLVTDSSNLQKKQPT